MSNTVTIKNLNGKWNIVREDGTSAGHSRNLKIAVQNCSDSNLIIANMDYVIDNLYRTENMFLNIF